MVQVNALGFGDDGLIYGDHAPASGAFPDERIDGVIDVWLMKKRLKGRGTRWFHVTEHGVLQGQAQLSTRSYSTQISALTHAAAQLPSVAIKPHMNEPCPFPFAASAALADFARAARRQGRAEGLKGALDVTCYVFVAAVGEDEA